MVQYSDKMLSNSIVVLFVLFGLSASDVMHTPDKTYFLSTENLNWTDARAACIEAGLELASVRSNEERDAVEAFLEEHNPKPTSWYGYWLAGIKYPNGTFYWDTTDIEVGDNVENGWLPYEPNDAFDTENCLELKWDEHNLGWNDFSCDEEKPYICQNPRKEDSTGKGLDDYSFLLETKPRNPPSFLYRDVYSSYSPFIRRSPEGFHYFDLNSYIKFNREKTAQSDLESTTTSTTTQTPEDLVGSTLESITTTNNPESLVESNPDYAIIHRPQDLVRSSEDLVESNLDSSTTRNNGEYVVAPQDLVRSSIESVTKSSPEYLARSDLESFTTSTTGKLDQLELESTIKSTSENLDSLESSISFSHENSELDYNNYVGIDAYYERR